MLVFGVRSKLSLLVESHDCFMDGTFKTAPSLFDQLYTIHALTTISTVPCVYALLTNKQQATYTTSLNELKKIEARY
jgi:hypothetical protein